MAFIFILKFHFFGNHCITNDYLRVKCYGMV